MKLLNICREDKILKLNFTELQLSNKDNKIGSGLMYDFDIYNRPSAPSPLSVYVDQVMQFPALV